MGFDLNQCETEAANGNRAGDQMTQSRGKCNAEQEHAPAHIHRATNQKLLTTTTGGVPTTEQETLETLTSVPGITKIKRSK